MKAREVNKEMKAGKITMEEALVRLSLASQFISKKFEIIDNEKIR